MTTTELKYRPRPRVYRMDAWRAWPVPPRAIVGVDDTGMWSDSPCKSTDAQEEIARFRRDVLRPAGIRSTVKTGHTANVFCAVHWILVPAADFDSAVRLVKEHRDTIRFNYRLMYEAELSQLQPE